MRPGLTSYAWVSSAAGAGVGFPTTQSIVLRATVGDAVSPFTGTSAATITVDSRCFFCGDCSSDEMGPDVFDSLAAAQIAVGILAPTATQNVCCDVNNGGFVDTIDILLIAQDAVGQMPLLHLPVASSVPCLEAPEHRNCAHERVDRGDPANLHQLPALGVAGGGTPLGASPERALRGALRVSRRVHARR